MGFINYTHLLAGPIFSPFGWPHIENGNCFLIQWKLDIRTLFVEVFLSFLLDNGYVMFPN